MIRLRIQEANPSGSGSGTPRLKIQNFTSADITKISNHEIMMRLYASGMLKIKIL
jgi:hypothetical protein